MVDQFAGNGTEELSTNALMPSICHSSGVAREDMSTRKFVIEHSPEQSAQYLFKRDAEFKSASSAAL